MSTTRQRDVKKWTVEDEYEEPPQYSAERLEEIAKAKRGIVVFPIRVPEPKSDTSSAIAPLADVTIPSVTAYFPAISSAFIRRVDTIQLYLFTSLYLASPSVPSSHKIHLSASIDPKAFVSRMDCLIAAKVTVAEKAVVKRCVLGYGVTIAKGAKLLGCVLMDGASVAEGANLEGCVVGRHAIIGVEAKLKDCQIAEGFFVEEDSESFRFAYLFGVLNADDLVFTAQARDECFVAFTGLDDSRPKHDETCDGGNNMEDENDQKGLEGHSPITMNRTTITPENQKVERTERTSDDQESINDCVDEMTRKLEKVDNIPEEGCVPAASNTAEVDTESDSGNKKAAPISDLLPANTEGREQGTPPSMARWWLSMVVLVWVVPIIGFGIWYGTAVVFGQHRDTI